MTAEKPPELVGLPKDEGSSVGYWDKKRAAAYLSVSPYTIDYLVRVRRLPYHLIANKRRFTRADLDALARAGRLGRDEPTEA
jgi:excisionase family DNA binding protein